MQDKNKLLVSDLLSVFGSGVSDIALLTMAFYITGSASITAVILSFRLLSSVLVFFVISRILDRYRMRWVSFISDMIRAVFCIFVVFTWDIYLLAIFSIIISFCSGVNASVKIVAYQKIIPSEERMQFIAKQQFLYGFLSLLAPFLSSLIIVFSSLKTVFVAESVLFFLSSILIFNVADWDLHLKKENTKDKIKKSVLMDCIIKNNVQRSILFFRLSILSSMVVYQVASTYILTINNIDIIQSFIPYLSLTYSDILAYFSFIATLSMLVGSLLSGKLFNKKI